MPGMRGFSFLEDKRMLGFLQERGREKDIKIPIKLSFILNLSRLDREIIGNAAEREMEREPKYTRIAVLLFFLVNIRVVLICHAD